jgi:hypothetical protein
VRLQTSTDEEKIRQRSGKTTSCIENLEIPTHESIWDCRFHCRYLRCHYRLR